MIDVAGGGGLLSYELTVRYGVNSTVIDPRTIKLNSMLRRKIRKISRQRSSADGTVSDKSPLITLIHSDPSLMAIDDGIVLQTVNFAMEDKEALPFAHVMDSFVGLPSDSISSGQFSIVAGASMLVGMHPDIVTEKIVDCALQRGLPFAVVPCCVFPKEFPHRITSEGNTVTTYEEFVTYLQSKHPSIQQGYLPFLGRNIVLYTLPTSK